MATARPPGGGGTPTARINLDLSVFRGAPAVAREAGQGVAREITNAFRLVQNEQRIAVAQAQQALAAVRAQQSQITATSKAESAERIAAAKAESVAKQQQARVDAATAIEEERRKTAAFKSEISERNRAQRASQVSGAAFRQGTASFIGSAFGGPIGGIAGALSGGTAGIGLAAGLAVREGVGFALEASQTAVAYDRQRVAALNLAGSQDKLNQLLVAYDRASGGAIDKATALSNVTRLQATGFAKTGAELERFVSGVRGSSIAMGKEQDEISQEVQLAISNRSFKRLDQIGLGVQEVTDRIAELRSANKGLSQDAAFSEAVLGLLDQKFGALTRSAEGQATGVERLTVAWKNYRLELGNRVQPVVNSSAGFLEKVLIGNTVLMQAGINPVGFSATPLGGNTPNTPRNTPLPSLLPSAANQSGNTRPRPFRAGTAYDRDQEAVFVDRWKALGDVNSQVSDSIADQNRNFGRQRAKTESDYQKGVLREEQDFARQRINQERKFNLSLLDIAQDSARQRARWEADTQRAIEKRRQDRDERIDDLNADFAKDQEKREKDHWKRMLDAAADYDAVAIREEQERFADEAKEQKEAHEDQINDAKEAFKEFEDEQRDSLQRRIDEQRENDELRIAEMKQAFEDQKIEEDAQREVMRQRREDDHADQMIEMDNQHAEDIQQLKDHAQARRDEIEEQFKEDLAAVGIYVDGYQKEINRIVAAAVNSGRAYINGLVPGAGHPSQADPYDDGSFSPTLTPAPNRANTTISRVVNFNEGAIVIQSYTGEDDEAFAHRVAEEVVKILEDD